jgi:hypothetical protein
VLKHLATVTERDLGLNLSRRSFLTSLLGTIGFQALANPNLINLEASNSIFNDPVRAWLIHLAQTSSNKRALFGSSETVPPDLNEFPWTAFKELLQSRFTDIRRHFAFEYYPWYANAPFRHWQQWDREPPIDIAASSMPLLGAYDSRSAAVLEKHARWIAESGVGVVNLSWWGKESFSNLAVPLVMDVMNAHDIHVTFFLEPYGHERVSRLSSDIQYLLREYGDKRGWDCFFLNQWADGSQAPVFKFFATTLFPQVKDCKGITQNVPGYHPDEAWRKETDRIRQMLTMDFPRLTLLSTDTGNHRRTRKSGFDGTASYDPKEDLNTWLDNALSATQHQLVFSFNINAGLDEIERRNLPSDSCLKSRPFVPKAPPFNWSKEEDRELAKNLSEQRIQETLVWGLLLQTHPWLGNSDAGFFLTYITSFNEWHEGTQFEPMQQNAFLTNAAREVGYHNPQNGFYRLQQLTKLLSRLLD